MPATGNGVCSRTFPIPVLSEGAASSSDSLALAYSNSKPTMSRPTPTATPLVGRFAGVVVVPINAVASANVGEAEYSTISNTIRSWRIPNDTIRAACPERRRGRTVMDLRLTAEQTLLRRSVREFAEAEIRPHVREWDDAQHYPPELTPKLAELGLMGIQFPEAYGGAAMSSVDYCICIEELARVDPSICLSVAAHNGLGAAHIAAFGTEAQKQQYLVPLARGEKLAAWGLTEASSGSDAASMQTRAVREGDCWVITGTKQFITHGRSGDLIVVMVVTNKAKGSRGITAFIVERGAAGFRAGKKEDKLGMRASETSEVIFDHCRIPGSQLLGVEGQGFINALQVLDAGRIGIAALAVGLAQGAYEAARDYAFERRQFG